MVSGATGGKAVLLLDALAAVLVLDDEDGGTVEVDWLDVVGTGVVEVLEVSAGVVEELLEVAAGVVVKAILLDVVGKSVVF